MSHFWNENEAAPGYDNLQGQQSFQSLPSHFTAEPLATFDLTPASGSDGMVFNLTPAPAVQQVPPPVSYNLNTPSLTPDFTGLLPPPPPPSHVTTSRPPPHLLSSVSPHQSPRPLSPRQTANLSLTSPLLTSHQSQRTPPPPNLSLAPPNVSLPPPQVSLPSSQVSLPPPHLSPSSSHLPTGQVSLPPPQVSLSPSQVSLPPPQVSHSPSQVSLPPPQVSHPPSQVSIPAAKVPYKAPPPYKSPPYYQESSPAGLTSPPPPPYPGQGQSKLPAYSLEELKDLPGANLKKSTVDLNTYISAMALNKHPNFENVDSFAERCLACIVRKIKSNLPTLKALLDSSLAWRGDAPDPGCVLIPRMKDGRITISRVGGGPTGAAGTKKIHPHLALVQIFKNPAVTNHNCLVSVAQCAAPFSRPGDEEREMVCISPMHYNLDNDKLKSPTTPRKKVTNQINSVSGLPRTQPIESSRAGPKAIKQDEKSILLKSEDGTDSDLLTSSDDDGEDWVGRWSGRVRVQSTEVQQFQVSDLVRQIRVMSVDNDELVEADVRLIERLKILEDFEDLMNGQYDLSQLRNLNKMKTKKTVSKPTKPVKPPYTGKKRGPKPKKKLGETWISQSGSDNSKKQNTLPTKQSESPNENLVSSAPNPGLEDKDEEEVIQNLLEDIKGSFESQFDMDLDTFGGTEGSSDFGMATSFNLSSLDVLSKDSFVDQNLLGPPIVGGSSDEMFGGNSIPLNIPDFEQDWNEEKEDVSKSLDLPMQRSLMEDLSFVSGSSDLQDRADQAGFFPGVVDSGGSSLAYVPQFSPQQHDLTNQTQNVFSAPSYLPTGTLSQDQFLNMFDED